MRSCTSLKFVVDNMKSSLFKPVYFTKPMTITRRGSSNLQLDPSTLHLNSNELNENINHNSSISDINVTKPEDDDSKLNRSTKMEVGHKDVYIARPSKGLISSHRGGSPSLTRSFSMNGINDVELVFTPKMKQVNKPHSALTSCNPKIHKDNGPIERKQSSPMKSSYPHGQSSSAINSFVVEGSTTAISHRESLGSAQSTSIRVKRDSETEPGANLMATTDKIPPLTCVREYTETKSFIAPITLSQKNFHSYLLKDKVVYLEFSGADQWVLSNNSDPKVKQILSSGLCFCTTVSEILPIQQVETDQLSRFHGSYQMAKITSVEMFKSNLIFKTVNTLTVDLCQQIQIYVFEPFQPKLLKTNIETIDNEIKVDPYNHYEAHWVEVKGYLYKLGDNNIVSVREYEANRYRSDAWFDVNQRHTTQNTKSNNPSSILYPPERSLSSTTLLEESCDIQELDRITPDISASNSAVPSSNSLTQDVVNQRVTLDLCKLKCHLLTVSPRQSSRSPSPVEGLNHESGEGSRSSSSTEIKADQGLLKLECAFNTNLSSPSSKLSVRDLKVIPRISVQDESQNDKSNPLLIGKVINSQSHDETLGGSKLSVVNSKNPQTSDSNNTDDSSILIPEGFPGGLRAISKTNDIYLNCKAVHSLQINKVKRGATYYNNRLNHFRDLYSSL